MLTSFSVGSERLDSLDLKTLIVTKGIKVSHDINERFGKTYRIYPEPLTCNCLILPDGTVVHMPDVDLHMRYLKRAILLESLRNLRYAFKICTPFWSGVSNPALNHQLCWCE